MVYRHADGRDPDEVLEAVLAYREAGPLAVRCQIGGYGGRVGAAAGSRRPFPGAYYDPDVLRPSARRALRPRSGRRRPRAPLLLHDIHERLASGRGGSDGEGARALSAVLPRGRVARPRTSSNGSADAAPPDYHAHRDGRAARPPARMADPYEGTTDRHHPRPLRRSAASPPPEARGLVETFGVRTAWHGPGDVSPIGTRRTCTSTWPAQLRHPGGPRV